jgi:uncharacterized protein
METPCVQICVLDPVSNLCIGCGRTGTEIGGWTGMTPDQRRAIIAGLPERMHQMTSRTMRGPRQRQRIRP